MDSSAEESASTRSPGPSALAASLRATREQDRRKGLAISHQMIIWNALLDARIQLQKALCATNSLVSASREPRSLPLSEDAVRSVTQEAFELSRELLALQSNLYRSDALDLTSPPDPPFSGNDDQSLPSLCAEASNVEAVHNPHLLRTLSKWSAKIQVVAPSSTFASKFSHSQVPGVVHAIQDQLGANKEDMLTRTRTFSSKDDGLQNNPEVYNDSEFYQQLLRDVIESKSSIARGEDLPWQNRKNKRVTDVDTKASKGRKLRYEVHEKLQHFMIPIPVASGAWPDGQIDELFGSLVHV